MIRVRRSKLKIISPEQTSIPSTPKREWESVKEKFKTNLLRQLY